MGVFSLKKFAFPEEILLQRLSMWKISATKL